MNEVYSKIVTLTEESQRNIKSGEYRLAVLLCEKIIIDTTLLCSEDICSEASKVIIMRLLKRNDYTRVCTVLQKGDPSLKITDLLDDIMDFRKILKRMKFSEVGESGYTVSSEEMAITIDTVYKLLNIITDRLKADAGLEQIYPENIKAEDIQSFRVALRDEPDFKVMSVAKDEMAAKNKELIPIVVAAYDKDNGDCVVSSTESVPEATGGVREVVGEPIDNEVFVGISPVEDTIEVVTPTVDIDEYIDPINLTTKVSAATEIDAFSDTVDTVKQNKKGVRFAFTPSGE